MPASEALQDRWRAGSDAVGHPWRMKSRVHPKYKTRYRVTNWREYERGLVQRGDVTVWLWISDPSCQLAEQRIVGVVEGEQKGGAMTAPAKGPAERWAVMCGL